MQRSLLVAAFGLVLLASSAQAQVPLKWKFNEGEKFFAEEKSNVKQTTTVQGMVTDKHEIQTTICSFEIQKVTAEQVVLVQTIEDFKVQLLKGNAPPGDDDVIRKLKGSRFTITLNKAGQITDFQGYDDLVAKLAGGNQEVARIFRSMLPKESLQKIAENTFIWTPPGLVDKGDNWRRETSLNLGPIGSMKARHKYTYMGRENGLDIIHTLSDLSYSPAKVGGDANLPFKIVRGTMKADVAKGSIQFDPKLGRPTLQSNEVVLRGTLTVEAMGMEVDVDMLMEQKTTTRLISAPTKSTPVTPVQPGVYTRNRGDLRPHLDR